MEIRLLTELTETDYLRLTEGYTSTEYYRVERYESDSQVTLKLSLESLKTPYVKRFIPDDDDEYSRYCGYLRQGTSIGLYEGDILQGLAITEVVNWNKSLWIWEFHIARDFQGQGHGRAMMEQVAVLAEKQRMRLMVCETQNTNVPAIRFYRKLGFQVDGIDLTYYSNNAIPSGEIAVFMKRHLPER